MMKTYSYLLLASASLVLAGCAAQGQSSGSPRVNVEASVKQIAFQKSSSCSESFVTHTLEHMTKARVGDKTVYDSNGAGVAVADLNRDGLQDIVLGNLDGPAHILWNQGDFKFKSSTLIDNLGLKESGIRAVQIIDANADGMLDIAFTHTRGGISLWDGDGKGNFKTRALDTVTIPAYTMLWDDLDGDNDLDLVTASYDAMLETESKDFLISNGGGVVVYDNQNGTLKPNRIMREAQSLAIALYDVNADGRRDLIVGNDFAVPDYIYLNTKTGWTKANPFKRTTKNTMGFTVGDTNNDGSLEFFATDMKPDFKDREVLPKWMPFMEKTFQKLQYKSLQRAENVLQRQTGPGTFQNTAYELGLDATGWSWSAQFGDLDNNGFQDLYLVNGMIDKENLKYLPNNELIEQNRAYKNTNGNFALENSWKLDSSASGRGMAFADFNNDGRLDIVVNNLEKSAQLFENTLCGGSSLEVELNAPQTKNTHGLGATVILHSSAGTMTRELFSQSGYLSGMSPRVHFGFPENTTLESLEVIWSDGKQSILKNPTQTLTANNILEITRSQP
jgi:enediyne biosynthesis protein E4